MKITFVMGIPCSGKSHYIRKNYKDRKILDLLDYQDKKPVLTREAIAESYEELKDDIIEAIKNNEDIVVEHTFLRAIRRKPYIDAIREVTDAPIDVVLINPPVKVIQSRREKRNLGPNEDRVLYELSVLEIPTVEEGFSKVTIVKKGNDKENIMELGNLIFGNSRGPVEFNRNFVELPKWQELLDKLGADFYGHVNGDKFKGNEYDGIVIMDKDNEKLFEIFPYYWGECTCGCDENNWRNIERLKEEMFTPEEKALLFSIEEPECDELCPASDEFNADNFDKPLEELAKICTCGACDERLKIEAKREAISDKFKEYRDKCNKLMTKHDKECPIVKHNFIYREGKENEFWIDWYKYPFRDSYSNKEVNEEQFEEILDDCINGVEYIMERSERDSEVR